MHCGKAQVGSTLNLCPRFNPGSPELNPGRRSNSGPDMYKQISNRSNIQASVHSNIQNTRIVTILNNLQTVKAHSNITQRKTFEH